MTDFIETSNTRTATRVLASPIADIGTFQSIIQAVIDDNPFGCVAYVKNGVSHDGVEKNRESYTAKVVFQDGDGKTVGSISAKAPTADAFGTIATALAADEDLATAMGGDALRDQENDSYSCQLRCNDSNGETYYVTFSREKVRISSFQDEGIQESVEIWADTVEALS